MNETVRAIVIGLSFVAGVVIDFVAFLLLGWFAGLVIAPVVVIGLGVLANETSANPVRR